MKQIGCTLLLYAYPEKHWIGLESKLLADQSYGNGRFPQRKAYYEYEIGILVITEVILRNEILLPCSPFNQYPFIKQWVSFYISTVLNRKI